MSIFERLNALPKTDPFWVNPWLFSQSVFWNESRQGTDEKMFTSWFCSKACPQDLRRYIERHNGLRVSGFSAAPDG